MLKMNQMVKLSKTQQELFEAMKSGTTVRFMPYAGRFNPNPYYYRGDNFKRITSAAMGLRKKGIAVPGKKDIRGAHTLELTEEALRHIDATDSPGAR